MTDSSNVAYQGAPGAFSEDAAIAMCGEDMPRTAAATFGDAFDAVAWSRVRFGVVPIENTLAGSVHAVYDLLGSRDVRIVCETTLRVSHVLAGAPGATLERLRRVRSHPMALAQCERFFRARPEIELALASNTAGAVADVVALGREDEGAIGSKRAAQRYGAAILASDLEDDTENFTRFLLLGRQGEPPFPSPGPWKTSVMFTLAHRAGTLARALEVFADRGIDLAKIESRPIRGRPFEYSFYVDVIGMKQPMEEALHALGEIAASICFGTYCRR